METVRIPKDINELNYQLNEAFALLRDDPRRHNQCKELANLAGKIQNNQRLLLMFAVLRGEKPELPYLGKTSGKPLPQSAFLLKG